MYYEEQMIDGVMHWRSTPDGVFEPYTLESLSTRYAQLKQEVGRMLGKQSIVEAA
jgi:hypothetical protein